jgi:hypothetical protein
VSAVAAQTDRRFRRAHVKPIRRKRGWLPGAAADLAGVAAAVYGPYRATPIVEQAR